MAIKYLVYQKTDTQDTQKETINNIVTGEVLEISSNPREMLVLKWDDTNGNIEDVNEAMSEQGFTLTLNTDEEIKTRGTNQERPPAGILPDGFSYLDETENQLIYTVGGVYKDDFGDQEILREGLISGALYCRTVNVG